jgi:hypothetical protein
VLVPISTHPNVYAHLWFKWGHLNENPTLNALENVVVFAGAKAENKNLNINPFSLRSPKQRLPVYSNIKTHQ